ncbi:MAG: hypothetical protein M5U22_05985 [Thermoleophilia bacterium]|nr:hypothetical protein [Thermoleophilia bacterium]
MSKVVSILVLLLGAQVNLSALVPAAPGQAPPPWWVGGGLLWPFFSDTSTLLRAGGVRDALTPLLGIAAAACFLLAAAALLGWLVPPSWFSSLVVAGAVASMVLQVVWLSGWAVLPLLVDAALLWSVFALHLTVDSLRG